MGPLEGLKILDLGTMMAGPYAATFLADLGADVIKVEHPKMGDHSRQFGPRKEGVALFWKSIGRNKRSITLDLSKPRGQELLRRLAAQVDVIIENFRPGTLEKWNVGYEELKRINPRLIMQRTSGFGYGGPYTPYPGFGTLVEAMSGFAHVTGSPDGPPTLPQFALADGIAAIWGAMGVLAAVYQRDVRGGPGQWIDNPLYEPIMRIMEVMLLEYDQTGHVRQRLGNRIPDAAPRGAYETAEKGRWVALSGSAQAAAMRVFRAIGREDLAEDPRLQDNQGRVKHVDLIDQALADWIGRHTLEEALETFRACDAPAAPVYDAAGIFADPHFRARQTLVEVPDRELGSITMMNVGPRFSEAETAIRFTGPALGEHNREVYADWLGLSDEELEGLRAEGVI